MPKPTTLAHRAEEANQTRLGPFVLSYAGFRVQHDDMRALCILARALQSEGSAWHIMDARGDHFSAWVPGMLLQEVGEF